MEADVRTLPLACALSRTTARQRFLFEPGGSMWEKSIRQIGFESVIGADAGNGIRVFLPDIGMFLTGLAVWLVCRSLVTKRPAEDMAQDNAHFQSEDLEEEEKLSLEGNILLEEEDHEAGYEAEDDDDEELYDEEEERDEEEDEEEEEEEEEEAKESVKMRVLRIVAGVASKVKEIIGNLITTAGKVVVTILLGLTGIMLPSLTSAVYFFVFLFLCTWWSFCRTIDTLLFSCMCVLMAIFSSGHLVVLYLYQFQFFQEAILPTDSFIRSEDTLEFTTPPTQKKTKFRYVNMPCIIISSSFIHCTIIRTNVQGCFVCVRGDLQRDV
ncbi:Piezo-type mechanosensitive ion channel component 2 [Merluccius polli]|uniref:Piezo-type mechanosensitive ion channel component 2 n=1 Tax=Merluccius polli TaxID=89951 RepID=A0AA47M403_MERPO|nr:Piezo-type mechanosensitive ion channel component 2 [Merluccius polli]